MLTRLPEAFPVDAILPDQVLNDALAAAQRQRRLVRRVFWGTMALSALSMLPQLSGAGPVLTWAAQGWPSTFGALVHLMDEPISPAEAVGSIAILAGFSAVCLRELVGLHNFEESLTPLVSSLPVLDALGRLAKGSTRVSQYVALVESVRAPRIGDWLVARSLHDVKDRASRAMRRRPS